MKQKLFNKLSPREQEIFILLAEGLLYKSIAERLHISIETVRTHVRNIYKKLGVNSRMEAMNCVFKRSFITLK